MRRLVLRGKWRALVSSALVLVLALGVPAAAPAASAQTASGATISTELPKYHPGDTVNYSGSGFAPGESVTVQAVGDFNNTVVQAQSTVDASGNIRGSFKLYPVYELNYALTATGGSSGRVATGSFEDPLTSVTISPTSASKPSGQTQLFIAETKDGSVLVGGSPVVWSTTDPSGTVTPTAAGSGKTCLANPPNNGIPQCTGGLTDGQASATYTFGTTTGTYKVQVDVQGKSASADVTVTGGSSGGDTAAPTSVSISINDGATWTNSAAVTVDIAASDNVGITKYRLAESVSGLDSASDVAVSPAQSSFSASNVSLTLSGGDNASKTVYLRVYDAAGNTAGADDAIGLDTTRPTISASAVLDGTTTAYTPGTWTNKSVAVSFQCADSLSGVAASTVAGGTVSAEGANQSVTSSGSCTDNAGNAADAATFSDIDVDKTKPTISAAATTNPNGAGWYNSNVTVQFTCDDALSGIATGACPTNETLSSEGTAVSSTAQTVTDIAGNVSTQSNVVTVKIDKTEPTLAPTISPTQGLLNNVPTVLLNSTPTASPNASDGLSGIASQSCGAVNTSSVGPKSVTCTATDVAGNTKTATLNYSVIYNWTGFFQPIDNTPTVNKAKAGSSIPVKFNLGGNQGLNIFATGSPGSAPITCGTAPSDDIETYATATAGGSTLTYDTAANQYVYVWKTESAWAGSGCRQLTVRLTDGTTHTAVFNFVK
jgi:hypothetical protein